MFVKAHACSRSLSPLALAVLAVGSAGEGARGAPVERVWANGPGQFQTTAIDEVVFTGSSSRRTVTAAHHIGGGQLEVTVWDESGWQSGRGFWSMQGISALQPTCVREISTGEFLVSGTAVYGGGSFAFVAIFDAMTLVPVAGLVGSNADPGTRVFADETHAGDIVIASGSAGHARLLSLPRNSAHASGFGVGSFKVAFLQTAAGDTLTVDAMRVSPAGSIVIAGGRGASLSSVAYLATIDPVTLAPIAAAEYPEVHLDARFSSLCIDGSTLYAGGRVSTPSFPDFITSARVISVPEALNAVNWDRTYATDVAPADLRLASGTTGADLWFAGTTPNGHRNGLMRLDDATGLPITFTRFRTSELSGLTGLAIDHSGPQPLPVTVGHWRSGPTPPNPIYGLFVRCDSDGTTACSSFMPLSSSPTPASSAALQLADVTPNPWAFAFIAWPWTPGVLNLCVHHGPPPAVPDPACPGFTACHPPCRIDLTGDGSIDLFDLAEFINLFQAAHPAADFDDNGVLNFFDFASCIAQFQAGCP